MSEKHTHKGQKTKEKILLAAIDLMRKQGFAATSIKQILIQSKQPKGSLYFHFPKGKLEIASFALARSATEIANKIKYAFKQSNSAYEALTQICNGFADQLRESSYQDGCPVSPMNSSASNEVVELRKCCAKAYEEWLKEIEDGLREFEHQLEPSVLASLILSAVEGAILLSQARQNTIAIESLPESLASILC